MSDSESEAGSDVSQPSTAATDEQLYDYDQCIAALDGRDIPDYLTSAAARCAVIRGLRCSYEFAMSQGITPEAQLHCIWNADFASEQTYCQVAQQYPPMRYQVGRACTAAGYFNLYLELDLLPEVSIAEEAREGNTEGEIKSTG
ncbi:hypothetical protein BDV10DRAFT_186146 [Aspergillus recurvatus]